MVDELVSAGPIHLGNVWATASAARAAEALGVACTLVGSWGWDNRKVGASRMGLAGLAGWQAFRCWRTSFGIAKALVQSLKVGLVPGAFSTDLRVYWWEVLLESVTNY